MRDWGWWWGGGGGFWMFYARNQSLHKELDARHTWLTVPKAPIDALWLGTFYTICFCRAKYCAWRFSPHMTGAFFKVKFR